MQTKILLLLSVFIVDEVYKFIIYEIGLCIPFIFGLRISVNQYVQLALAFFFLGTSSIDRVSIGRVRHDEIITQLTQLEIDGKDLRVIKNMYWEQTAAMRVEEKSVHLKKKLKQGVRQGCVLFPHRIANSSSSLYFS